MHSSVCASYFSFIILFVAVFPQVSQSLCLASMSHCDIRNSPLSAHPFLLHIHKRSFEPLLHYGQESFSRRSGPTLLRTLSRGTLFYPEMKVERLRGTKWMQVPRVSRGNGTLGDNAPEWGIWFQARCTILKGFNNNICCLGGNQSCGLLGNKCCLL